MGKWSTAPLIFYHGTIAYYAGRQLHTTATLKPEEKALVSVSLDKRLGGPQR